jgi:hypothetical protein
VYKTALLLQLQQDAEVAEIRDALSKRRADILYMQGSTGQTFDGKLLVVADDDTPYRAISSILMSAGAAQFSDFELVVLQKTEKK